MSTESLALETLALGATPTPHPAAAANGRRLGRMLLSIGEGALVWIVLLGAWFAAAEYFPLGDNPLIPSPHITVQALWTSLPELWVGTVSSFSILLPGFLIATILGIVFGVTVGS